MPDTPRLYVGTYAVCFNEKRILLVRAAPTENNAGSWTLPGGGLHWGEVPEEGVLRELLEETGLTGNVTRVAGIFSATYLHGPDRADDSVHHLGIVYFVEASPGELRYEQNGSTDSCAWFTRADLADLRLLPLGVYGLELASTDL